MKSEIDAALGAEAWQTFDQCLNRLDAAWCRIDQIEVGSKTVGPLLHLDFILKKFIKSSIWILYLLLDFVFNVKQWWVDIQKKRKHTDES